MDNKQVLLDRAMELFSQRGYDAVGVREVVEAAGGDQAHSLPLFRMQAGIAGCFASAGRRSDAGTDPTRSRLSA